MQWEGERYIECHRTAVSPRATRSPHQARCRRYPPTITRNFVAKAKDPEARVYDHLRRCLVRRMGRARHQHLNWCQRFVAGYATHSGAMCLCSTAPTGYVWLPQAAAALRAGYTQTRAKQTAYRLLGHPEVSSLVAKLDEAKRDDLGLDAHDVLDRALELYGRAMRGNPRTYRDEVVRDENGDVIYDPNLGAAAKALELIARQLGLLSDRRIVEHGGDVVYTLTLDRELPELEDDTAA